MKHPTGQGEGHQEKRRNPGYAPIRRGILEHWSAMSANARAFYVWLHLTAFWKGPKRGWVEASFDDMARANGWSTKTVQRTIEELEVKPYIEVYRAANQHELTRIKILKYDLEEPGSAVDKSVHSSKSQDEGVNSAVDSAADSGADKFVHSTAPTRQNQQDLHAAKKLRSKEEKKRKADAVRRRFDAEHRPSIRKVFSPSEKKEKLATRLEAAVRKNKSAFDCELLDDEREAFYALEYLLDDVRQLPSGFVDAVLRVWEKYKDNALPSGILCSKVIDYCMKEQESYRKLKMDPSDYFWPPDFQDHRNRLREEERQKEERARARTAVVRA